MTLDKRRSALWILAAVELLVFLEVSILNVALPAVGAALVLSAVALAWVVNGYQVAFGGVQLAAGHLVDVIGARRLFVVGLALFGAGSLLTGAATTGGPAVAGRVVQGVGAALLVPAELAMLRRLFPEANDYRDAMAVWSTMAAIGAAAGSALGGVITSAFGWPWVFWINVPVVLFVLALAPRLLPADHRPGARPGINTVGLLGATGASAGIVLTASSILDRQGTLAAVAAGGTVLAGVVFALNQAGHPRPLIPTGILRATGVRHGLLASILTGLTHVPSFVVLSVALQQGLGYSAAQAGLALLPIALANAIMARTLLSRALARWGAEKVFVSALSVCSVATGLLGLTIGARVDFVPGVLLPGLVLGVAIPGVFAGSTIPALSTTPQHLQGTVSGLLNTGQRLAAAVGVTAVLELIAQLSVRAGGTGWRDATAGQLQIVLITLAVLGLTAAVLLQVWASRGPGAAPGAEGRDNLSPHSSRRTHVTHAIEVHNLHKTYGQKTVLNGVNLAVPTGHIVALLGPNGAGKTTLVEILEGLRTADSGTVKVLGQAPWAAPRSWRDRIGVVLQTSTEMATMRVGEAVAHHRRYYSRPRDVDETLSLVGLIAKKREMVKTLSGGQRRRLDVALAIVGHPDLVFLDEPTTGFDPLARREFWDLIHSLRTAGTSVLLTTHYLDEAEELADTIYILVAGRIVTHGTVAQIVTEANTVPVTVNPPAPATQGTGRVQQSV